MIGKYEAKVELENFQISSGSLLIFFVGWFCLLLFHLCTSIQEENEPEQKKDQIVWSYEVSKLKSKPIFFSFGR